MYINSSSVTLPTYTQFSSAFSITMMFPFLPFMVEFLLPWLLENETQVGELLRVTDQ